MPVALFQGQAAYVFETVHIDVFRKVSAQYLSDNEAVRKVALDIADWEAEIHAHEPLQHFPADAC